MTHDQPLKTDDIPFAIWTEAADPATGATVPGQGLHRFYRFVRPAALSRLEVPARELVDA